MTGARHRMRQALAVALACFAVLAAQSSSDDHRDAPDAPTHGHLGEVAAGTVGLIGADVDAMHWHTPEIRCDGARVGLSGPASCVDHTPFTWTVDVERGVGSDLRVDFDQPYRQDAFRLRLIAPDGEEFEAASQNTYSTGLTYPSPRSGTYGIELVPVRTDGTTVRLRVGLVDEREPEEGELLPNLRATPPFEFGFAAPVNPLNSMFLATDDLNPALGAAGVHPVSCTADEVQEASDPTRNDPPIALVRCLRFTSGPQNVGAGHLDLKFPIRSRAQSGNTDQVFEMTQVVHHADGSRVERDAGTWEYHATHGHYHYVDVLHYELLAVRDGQAGHLEQVGLGRKSGLCPDDQGYGEWSSFAQSERGAVYRLQSGGCLPAFGTGNHAMGLSAGWGDYYRWQRPGQYVDFSLQPDGRYVVRVTVDILDNVLEEDETDNVAYALVEVSGDEVTILERGRGTDPWDPDKDVHLDGRR